MFKEYKKLTMFIVAIVVLGAGSYLLLLYFVGGQLEQTRVELVSTQHEPVLAPEIKLDDQLPEGAKSTKPVEVVGTPEHPANGTAQIFTLNGKHFLRYENFKTDNACDLYVYLATDEQAKNYVSLGRAKATEGNINYEIPGIVTPQHYPYALVWCKQQDKLFNSAQIYSF